MNIRFVEAFVWVARLKSFRAAAQKLNVSQATISGRISSIEVEFDCRLFDRAKHDVVLTNKGHLLLEKAERLLDAEQDLLESLKHHNSIVRNVRIGVIESIVHTWLGEFLTQLKILYPNIEFELTAEPTMHLQALFAKGALDIIIQTAPVLDSTVASSVLSPLEICWVGHKDSHLAHREVTFDEIAESEIITFTRDSQPHLALCSMFENKGLKPKQIHCVTSISIISHLVQEGLGVATLPMAAIKNELDNGDLVVLQGVESPPLLSLHASWENLTDGKMKCAIVELARSVSYGYTENIAQKL
ncbi:MAG: LysR family transcriptional regulator [Marinomonas sp.]